MSWWGGLDDDAFVTMYIHVFHFHGCFGCWMDDVLVLCMGESRLVKYHVGELAGWKEKAKIPMLYPAREGTL